jgi:hypothetical protein
MSNKNKYEIPFDYLHQQYVVQKKSTSEIALAIGCAAGTINRRLREYGIELRPQGEHNSRNLIGQRFGQWTVLKKIGSHNKCTLWLCECECGIQRNIQFGGLTSGQRTRCKICGHRSQRSPEEITDTIWGGIKRSAASRNISFDIEKEEAYDLFLEQQRKCALTGLDIGFAETMREHNIGKTTASLDRKDSSLGYVLDNVQWVHKEINLMKHCRDEVHFKKLCKLVAEYSS